MKKMLIVLAIALLITLGFSSIAFAQMEFGGYGGYAVMLNMNIKDNNGNEANFDINGSAINLGIYFYPLVKDWGKIGLDLGYADSLYLHGRYQIDIQLGSNFVLAFYGTLGFDIGIIKYYYTPYDYFIPGFGIGFQLGARFGYKFTEDMEAGLALGIKGTKHLERDGFSIFVLSLPIRVYFSYYF